MDEKPAQHGHKEVLDSQKGSEVSSMEHLRETNGLDKTQRNLKVPSFYLSLAFFRGSHAPA